jgi:cation diffusion facilitator family transporter
MTASRAQALTARKTSVAVLSIASNSVLIVAKIVAGALTGSVAILTEAIHSSIDLVASVIAYLSVRKSAEPPDRGHPYGHDKIENLAAVVEGVLILVGAAIIFFEATRRLVIGSEVSLIGIGIAVMAVSLVANVIVSRLLSRRAKETSSDALAADAAHLHADALTSGGVLAGLVLVELTGWNPLDSIVAMLVATVIVYTGSRILSQSSRVLVDQSLPEKELARVRDVIRTRTGVDGELISFHKLRARGSGGHRHIDLHVQFAAGTTLERAHDIAHELQAEISFAVGGADVLIHLEPETSARPEDASRG